jgi:hypothetical protein
MNTVSANCGLLLQFSNSFRYKTGENNDMFLEFCHLENEAFNLNNLKGSLIFYEIYVFAF